MKLAAVLALVALGVQAQTIGERLDALVAPYREANAPGMVALLIRDGRVTWQTAFGLADVEAHRRITPDTQFELASMTKQFTAMAIMILSEHGKLKFDDTLDKYCPEFPAYARTIHIRDLLHHVSGLPDYEELMVGKIGDSFFRSSKGPPAAHEFTSAEVLKTLSRQPKLKFSPGSRFEYNNSGYGGFGTRDARLGGQTMAVLRHPAVNDDRRAVHRRAVRGLEVERPAVQLSLRDRVALRMDRRAVVARLHSCACASSRDPSAASRTSCSR